VQFVATDGIAALVGVTVMFWLAYLFTDRLTEILIDVRRVERWLALMALLVGVFALVMATRRRGRLLIGE
jgi:hypothetical protein